MEMMYRPREDGMTIIIALSLLLLQHYQSEGNLLSIHFIDALDDLTVQVVNEQGAILYNEVVSGEAGECVSISLDQAGTGCFYVVLEHRLGQLTGDFIIQNN